MRTVFLLFLCAAAGLAQHFVFAERQEGLKLKEIVHDPQCGLTPVSFSTVGTALSAPITAAQPFSSVEVRWLSTLPRKTTVIKLRTSADGKKWDKWAVVNEVPAPLPGRPDWLAAKPAAAVPNAKFLQYQLELRRHPDFFSFCFRELELEPR